MLARGEVVYVALIFPLRKTAPEVTLSAGRGLITLLGSLGEQLHDDCGDGAREVLQPLAGRHGLSGNVGVHPFHRIGSRERKTAGQHFVKSDAKRVEVAPGINGAIHSSGLFGRHVGECSGDELTQEVRATGAPAEGAKQSQSP